MQRVICRLFVPIVLAIGLLVLGKVALAQGEPAGPIAPVASPNPLENASFECGDGGYYEDVVPPDEKTTQPNLVPNRWTITHALTTPVVSSTRIFYAKSCDGSAFIERIDGEDSVVIRALDLEWSSAPGKPFDTSLYQQVSVLSGTAYSLSGWMVSLCGGSFSDPNDCPAGYYMAKLLGIDPTGGTDPWAPTVQWAENRANFVGEDGRSRIGWQNLRLAATAEAMTVTVFARINSPFRWHGNHAFIDALSLVQAPTATLTATSPISGSTLISLQWTSDLGPDIPAIEGGKYRLYLDLEYWHDQKQIWSAVATGDQANGSTWFDARCTDSTYRFRIRARAEQPEGEGGAWPNQRYPGVWTAPIDVYVPPPLPGPTVPFTPANSVFLPLVTDVRGC
ncbi:MAG: hypothetical protein H3C34_05155 [Caldilineaceae bacterium]|nr:hypothetical protein [Caldilineaceae bacterium]